MRCKICGESFDRGTSTLPNDYCTDCFNKYIKCVEVKRTTKEMIDEANDMIQHLENNIIKHKKEIEEDENQIKYWKDKIKLT